MSGTLTLITKLIRVYNTAYLMHRQHIIDMILCMILLRGGEHGNNSK